MYEHEKKRGIHARSSSAARRPATLNLNGAPLRPLSVRFVFLRCFTSRRAPSYSPYCYACGAFSICTGDADTRRPSSSSSKNTRAAACAWTFCRTRTVKSTELAGTAYPYRPLFHIHQEKKENVMMCYWFFFEENSLEWFNKLTHFSLLSLPLQKWQFFQNACLIH